MRNWFPSLQAKTGMRVKSLEHAATKLGARRHGSLSRQLARTRFNKLDDFHIYSIPNPELTMGVSDDERPA